MDEGDGPSQVVVRALSMRVPEEVLRNEAEKKRVKKGITAELEERTVFSKLLHLPYLDFTYQYSAERGFLSKHSVIRQGRSVVIALREANFGFDPELTSLGSQLQETPPDSSSFVEGIDSTTLVRERLDELKRMLYGYDRQLDALSKRYESLPKTDHAKQDLKDNIDHLRTTRESRWRMFADGLRVPKKMDLEKLEVLEGNLFYMPYFIVRFIRAGESRFFVWDREGKENDAIADELMKNGKFRDLVLSYSDERGESGRGA